MTIEEKLHYWATKSMERERQISELLVENRRLQEQVIDLEMRFRLAFPMMVDDGKKDQPSAFGAYTKVGG